MNWKQLSTTHVKTRKDHHCIWCGDGIPKGSEDVMFTKGVQDGEITGYYMHPECEGACARCDCWKSDGYILHGDHYRGMDCEQTNTDRARRRAA